MTVNAPTWKGNYKDGKRDGPWIGYHYTGKVSEKGTYKEGKHDGPWVDYYKDGTVHENLTGTYRNGVKQ